MKPKKPALGKGLSALFPASSKVPGAGPGVLECPIDRIDAHPDQPRRKFEQERLGELAASIRESGVLQPLLVSREGDRYRLIAGERRLRAARMAGLATVPVVVRQATPEDAFLMALVENLQREDLNPVEQARAFSRLTGEFDLTQEEVARRVGKQRSTVANSVRLLKLHPTVLGALEEGRIAEGTARALLALPGAVQAEVLPSVQDKELSVREVEALVRGRKGARTPRSDRPERAMAGYFAETRLELEAELGIPVAISFRGNRGRIQLPFRSLAEFRALRDRILGSRESKGTKP
jgi:ParB family chromosome partitioning protein